jgi:EAL and modified HD-GYP domain-containing signal transduction protein
MQDDAYLIGRQPILNAQEEIKAFELLFRSQQSISSATFDSATQASSRVMFNAISTVGIENLLGDHMGFINVDLELLVSDVIEILPQQQVGLELLESIEITSDVVERCQTLKSLGYQLALDDHVYNPLFEPLYNGVVDIIKIDLFTTPLCRLSSAVAQFRRYPVKLVAEKVDSRDVFLRCRSMGFELFQGYFFARPTLIQKQRLTNTVTSFLKLMQQLRNDAEID